MGQSRVRRPAPIVYFTFEGERERDFIFHLMDEWRAGQNIHPDGIDSVRLIQGANKIIQTAINNTKGNKEYLYVVVFDADYENLENSCNKIKQKTLRDLEKIWGINKNTLNSVPYSELQQKNLKQKSPILIVSHPESIEGFMLFLLDMIASKPKTYRLKQALDGILKKYRGNKNDKFKAFLNDKFNKNELKPMLTRNETLNLLHDIITSQIYP